MFILTNIWIIGKDLMKLSLPSKESFYSNLNMEDIDDIDYRHGNNVFNKFNLNNLGDYNDLYICAK